MGTIFQHLFDGVCVIASEMTIDPHRGLAHTPLPKFRNPRDRSEQESVQKSPKKEGRYFRYSSRSPKPSEELKHGSVSCWTRNQELDSMILVGPFQVRIFCDTLSLGLKVRFHFVTPTWLYDLPP